MAGIELPADDVTQKSIAKKLKTLVAALSHHAAMGEGPKQKGGVREAMAEALLQGLRRHPLRFRRHSMIPLR